MINNFGPLSPPELLLHYGFVEGEGVVNPNNHTDLALADVLDAIAETDGKSSAKGALGTDDQPPWADVARARFRVLLRHGFVQPNGCCR